MDFSSVRSSSLGRTAAATGQGSEDFFSTPAALARTDASEASLMNGKPFSGIPDQEFGAGSLSLAVPTRVGTWGAGVASFKANGFLEETTYALGYGASFLNGRVRAGASLKRLDHKYLVGGDGLAQNDPLFRNGASRTAYDADLGMTVAVTGPLQAGLVVRNVRRADVGLGGQDRLPREVQGGLSLNLSQWGLTASGDLTSRISTDGSRSMSPSIGIEKSFQGAIPLFLRAGANRDRFSAGLGLRRGRYSLDYAFLMPRALSGEDAATHALELTLRFGSER
jgi:hypothetical protein